MKLLSRLIKAYADRGYEVRTGLNPFYFGDPDAPFTELLHQGQSLSTGRGLALLEILFLENLLSTLQPLNNALVIGNAFGWSTLAIAMARPECKVVAVDANVEGAESLRGKEITLDIARAEGLNLEVIDGFSPRDIPAIVTRHFDGPLDFVLIDGLHVNPQLIKDFNASREFAGSECVFLMHDVLHWHMIEAIDHIRAVPGVASVRILPRLPSGICVATLAPATPELGMLLDLFSEPTIDFDQWWSAMGANHRNPGALQARLAKGYPFGEIYRAAIDAKDASDTVFLANLKEVLAARPGNPEVTHVAAIQLYERGLTAEAETYFQEVARFRPNWAEPRFFLGKVAQKEQRFDAAFDFFDLASSLDRQWLPPLVDMGILALEQNREEWLVEAIRQLSVSAPDRSETQYFRTEYLRRYRFPSFPAALQQCIEFQMACPRTRITAWDHLEPLLLQALPDADTLSVIQQQSASHPAIKPIWKLLGLAFRLCGLPQDALSAFGHALSLAPSWPSVLVEMGKTYRMLGETEKAYSYLQKALEARPGFQDALDEIRSLSEASPVSVRDKS